MAAAERHEFQAEVKKLLDIVIHSLYTDKEIFVRELISNASDALEKLRHLQLTEGTVHDGNLPLEIHVRRDEAAGTVTFEDHGVGMTRPELIENLGTIAHSGSKKFLEAVSAGADVGANLIGQFGVGFYSAFMVADKVTVYTHSYRLDGESLVWSSDGSGSYTVEVEEGQRRGCKIVLQLKEDQKDFARTGRVREILKRYSSFVQFPITLDGERINTVQALWMKNRNEIKDEEYTEFYKFLGAFDEPLYRLHFSADAPLAINAILFTPRENPERWGFGRIDPSVGLYCRRVLIDAKPKGLLPEWLRFLKGVVDSADLPLNISRETMQDSALVQKLSRVLTNRYLKLLAEEAEQRPEGYREFYKSFGVYLKEGIATDPGQRDPLAKLVRFESSVLEKGVLTSLPEYAARAKPGQKEIYYLSAPSREAAEASASLEAFRARSIEVLYLYEPFDEFVMGHLREFDGKTLTAADQADVKLGEPEKPKDVEDGEAPSDRGEVPKPKAEELPEAEAKSLCEWLKETLSGRAADVLPSTRLVESPAVALNADSTMTPAMRRLIKAMRQEPGAEGDNLPIEALRVNLEINTAHALVKNLVELRRKDEPLAKMVAEQLFDNAMIAAGFLEDPRGMVKRVYQILERVSAGGGAGGGA